MPRPRDKSRRALHFLLAGTAAALVVGLVIFSLRYRDQVLARTAPPAPPPSPPLPPAGTAAVSLYFADEQYDDLIVEKRAFPETSSSEERIRRLVEALIAGPREAGHAPTLPSDAALKSVFIQNDVALLNFDDHLRSRTYGSTGELFLYRSLYATVVANCPAVKGVTVLIDGKPSHTLTGEGGHVASGFPLYGDPGQYLAPPPRSKL